MVGFDWRQGGPRGDFPTDLFRVRWTGSVNPPATGLYTFHTRSDDGVRLWLSGILVIDDWAARPVEENQVTVLLLSGIPVDVRLEYFEDIADASMSLSWSGPNIPRQLVPGRFLRPAP